MNNSIRKRPLAILLVISLLLSMFCMPVNSYAAQENGESGGKWPVTASGSEIFLSCYGNNDAVSYPVTYSEESGFTVIVPADQMTFSVRLKCSDANIENVTANLTFQLMQGSQKKTVQVPFNNDKRTVCNMLSVSKKEPSLATLAITENDSTKEYPIKVVKQANLKDLTLKGSDDRKIELTPTFKKDIFDYEVYGVGADEDVKISCNKDAAFTLESPDVSKILWNKDKVKNVTVKVNNPKGLGSDYNIKIYQAFEKLKLEKMPDKVMYKSGEQLDPTGMVIKAVYADGTSVDVPTFTVSPSHFEGEGKQTVTVSYTDKSVTFDVFVGEAFSKGDGSEEHPYEISTTEDFKTLSTAISTGYSYSTAHYLMTQDITLPENWMPVGSNINGKLHNFAGVFDGGGHTLTVPKGEKPLFGYVARATLKNLKIYGEQINGFGVVDNYIIGSSIDFDNVILLSGTKTLKSGFIGGYASGADKINIKNCTVEKGVVIGYDGNESNIGSFGGDFNGNIINCKSAATVKGKNFVGGIVGSKGQTMAGSSPTGAAYHMLNCEFSGEVIATGNYVGGIAGAGYGGTLWGIASAPNTPCAVIQNCINTGDVTGADYVGGILGAEPGVVQCWQNGIGYIQNNFSTGSVKATDGKYEGGIIGYMNSLNRYTVVSNNYFKENGKLKAIGGIKYIDTNNTNVDKTDKEVIYLDTSKGVKEGEIYGLNRIDHNRTDDPKGKDAEKLGKAVNDSELENGDVTNLLNSGENSFKNWITKEGNPLHSTAPVAYKLEMTGSCKSEYVIGEDFDFGDAEFTAYWTDGSVTKVDSKDIKVDGFENSKQGKLKVSLIYGAAKLEVPVKVLKPVNPDKPNITVEFTLLGDDVHDSDKDGNKHTLKEENLKTWVSKRTVEVPENSTVWDVLQKVAEETEGLEFSNPSGNYIDAVTFNGVKLAEFTNGENSGWMYTLNDKHPLLGIEEQYLDDGDNIVFHYTDDYTKEEGTDEWGPKPDPGEGENPGENPGNKPGGENPPTDKPGGGDTSTDKPSDKPSDKPAAKPDAGDKPAAAEKPATPKTGDENNVVLLGMLLLASAGTTARLARRKRNS